MKQFGLHRFQHHRSGHRKLLLVCVASLWLQSSLAHNEGAVQLLVPMPSGLGNDLPVALQQLEEPITALLPASGLDMRKVTLGRDLFHSTLLSGHRRTACVTCHDLTKGGSDGRPRARGPDNEPGQRNTSTVYNIALHHFYNLDGRFLLLGDLIDTAVIDPEKMDGNWKDVIQGLARDPRLLKQFVEIYGDGLSRINVIDALETYLRSLVTAGSRFDQFLMGNQTAISAKEKRGYTLFKEAGCVACHNGKLLGGNSFQRINVFNDLFEEHADFNAADLGRFQYTGQEFDRYAFRVPSLRNVELTAPYYHDGSADTLEFAVEEMAEHQMGIDLTNEEIDLIVAFLKTLTGQHPEMEH